ncbi:hypothetical protein [Enterobacter ludwigii]|uniref:hypothetical protein n=1 Tax=Enterobacter ludwigii TaxID=299767 RepID=UPI003075FB89
MSNIDKRAELRKELSNPANGSNSHLRKLALALLDELEATEKRNAEMSESNRLLCADSMIKQDRIAELEVVNELFLRAKQLMYQSGGAPIENSLNPIDAWLYDAESAAAAGKGE